MAPGKVASHRKPVLLPERDWLQARLAAAPDRTLRALLAELLFLLLCSSDLYQIEQVVAKLKTLLRKAGERRIEATWKRIGELLHLHPSRTRQLPHKRTRCLRPR